MDKISQIKQCFETLIEETAAGLQVSLPTMSLWNSSCPFSAQHDLITPIEGQIAACIVAEEDSALWGDEGSFPRKIAAVDSYSPMNESHIVAIHIRVYWKRVIAQYRGWTVVFQICTMYTAFLDKEIFHQSPGRRSR